MKLERGKYFGDTLHAIDINGIVLTKSNYEIKTSLPLHYHQNPYFCYVLNGSYSEHSTKKHLACSAGDIIFHPFETKHYNDFNENNSCCFNLELSASWAERIFESKLNLGAIIKTNKPEIQKLFIKIYREFNDYDLLSPLMIEGIMIQALITFSRSSHPILSNSYHIRKVKKYIDELYFTNPGLSELAGISKTSPEHLVRGFKKSFNRTIGEYMREVKVSHACNKLKNSSQSLIEIALETGFCDQSHFTRVFKKLIGVTPLEYRLGN
jgi:AraC family transcriptional regulator